MEEQEDEVGTMESSSTSSWSAVEGSLQQSVKVVEDSEDAVYTAGATSKLVLVPTSSSSSAEADPCELTVTFQQRLGRVHQIYVLSTARICEIYGQHEQDGDQDYVCTVRGGIISLAEDELPDNESQLSPAAAVPEDLTSADDILDTASVVPPPISESKSATRVQQQIPPSGGQSEELLTIGKKDSSQGINESPALTRRESEEDLFRSFTEAISGRIVDGSIIFEESLDQADWVECPHSPMKSSSLTSDDETEVDVTRSGFYFIDADVEAQNTELPRVRLLSLGSGNPGKNLSSLSLDAGDMGSSGHSSWQESTEEPTLEKSRTDGLSPEGSPGGPQFPRLQSIEERRDSPGAQLNQVMDNYAGENLPQSGFCVFEVNEERDSSSSAFINSTAGKDTTETHDLSSQNSKLQSSIRKDGDVESKLLFEPPVYECEVSLVDADAWTSVTIRLLSVKTKSHVEIHRVVITYTPGPPIQPPVTSPSGPFQQRVGTSSLLAMLVPGILQMARGFSEPRIAKNISRPDPEKVTKESVRLLSPVITDKSGSTSREFSTVEAIEPDSAKLNDNNFVPPPIVEENLKHDVEQQVFPLSDTVEGTSSGTSSLESIGDAGTQGSTGYHGQGLHESVLPQVVQIAQMRTVEEVQKPETGHCEARQKEENRVGELVQRLDRLETICLRMESSLNSALENMDKRLKLLELSGLGRISPLGHPIWGPSFDSGSFVSATSVHVPSAQTGTGTTSLMDSQVPFSICPDVLEGDSFAKDVTSAETVLYPGLLSSASASFIPSLSSALPVWPLSSWPQNLSPDSSSHSSGLTASFNSKKGVINQSNGSLHDSEHPSNGGETYWESRTSDDSETDISSDSEQTSYADNCEDSGCGCCPESRSSSPSKPAQLVENALASALSAFSASFGAQRKSVWKEDVVYQSEQDSDEVDSFTSEEQVPLVELESFPDYYEKREVTHADVEKVFTHGYEAIPLSTDREMGDANVGKISQEVNFWTSQHEENQQINWQDEGLQTKEEYVFRALEDFVNQTEGTTASEVPSAVCIQASNEGSMYASTINAVLAGDLETIFQKNATTEATEDDDADAISEPHVQDLQQNPFLHVLASRGDGNMVGAQPAWPQQGWSGKQIETAQNVLSSYVTVRGFSKPLDSLEEILLQEGLFPDEWNWFTSEFSPFNSLVEVKDLSEFDPPVDKEPNGPLLETVLIVEGSSPKLAPGQMEPWSLLDGDVSAPSMTEQFGRNSYWQDWLGQRSQWSLLDEDAPSLNSGDNRPEGAGDNGCVHKEPRSLLDEDISVPAGDFLAVGQDANLYSLPVAPADHLSDVEGSSKHAEATHSPSSQASKCNPFGDEYDERSDLSQGSNNAPLVLLEEFGEEVPEFEAAEPERTQPLLFHLSL